MDDTDAIIEEFLGDEPRAAEWRLMRGALVDRLQALRKQLVIEDSPEAIRRLQSQIDGVERQVEAIETEVAVTQFVEDSVKAALARPFPSNLGEADEDINV